MCADDNQEKPRAKPPTNMKTYQMAFLRRGPNWWREKGPESDKLFEQHIGHNMTMHKNGKMPLAGPFMKQEGTAYPDLAGICVYNVETREEALTLANQDPAVQAGVFTVEVVPWYGTTELLKISVS